MSGPIPPVDGVPVAPPVTPRGVRQPDGKPVEPAPEKLEESEASNRNAVLQSLKDEGDKLTFGVHVAEFSYDEDLDRVVIKVYTNAAEPREVVRHIPPEQYLAFVSKARELLGVLFDGLV
jgi:uncharacterized FlaG/YvyC family protein